MNRFSRILVLAFACCSAMPANAGDMLAHGRYVFFAAGCISCHTADQALAGGRPLQTPFGTFYPPNITPSPEYGIGAWNSADLERALRRGINPGLTLRQADVQGDEGLNVALTGRVYALVDSTLESVPHTDSGASGSRAARASVLGGRTS